MQKLFENFYIFHFQKIIVSMETILGNTVLSKGVFGLLWTTWVHKDILSTYIGNVNKGKLLCVEPLKHPYVLTNNQIYFLFGFSNIRQS